VPDAVAGTAPGPAEEGGREVGKAKAGRAPARDEGLQNLGRIRDIIFGPVMRDYERRFRRLELTIEKGHRTLQERSAALDAQLGELSKRFRRDLDDLETRAAQRIETIETRLREESDKTGQRIEQAKTDLRARIAKDIETTLAKIAAIRAEMMQVIEKASAEALEDREVLSNEKADRRLIGEALQALGKHLLQEPDARKGKMKA